MEPSTPIRARAGTHSDIERAVALVEAGKHQAAARLLRRHENDPTAKGLVHHVLGMIAHKETRFERAVEHLRQALAFSPNDGTIANSLGNALVSLGRFDDAMGAYRTAIELQPRLGLPHFNLAHLLCDTGDVAAGVAHYRTAIGLRPDRANWHSSLLGALLCRDDISLEALFREHQAWAARHAAPAPPPRHGNLRSRERKLKIGYVSPDLRAHSVACFLEPLLAAHDRDRVAVTCYADVASPDATTERIRRLADGWRTVAGVSDARLAERIRADGIDVLVDLAGHSLGNRLRTFGQRPAPVQVSYLGYPATTGMTQIDVRLTDPIADPAGEADAWHTERLVRIPDGFLAFRPAADLDVRTQPRSSTSPVTFGSFNTPRKVSPACFEAWTRVLAALPGSRLLLKARVFADAAVRNAWVARLKANGIEAERIELRGWEPTPEGHLAAYHDVDVALDTFPYNGTTTTCEALWMGVPVVTLVGDRHAGRVGASILTGVGLSEHVAHTVADYVGLAADLGRRCRATPLDRADLRDRVRRSALGDPSRLARRVEDAFATMWRAWCDTEAGATSSRGA